MMAWLYIGTFGSFVGYAAAFPLLQKTQFPEHAGRFAFLGPLVGSLARPLGGRVADRLGGAKVTFASFVMMALATLCAVRAIDAHDFAAFLTTFIVLFVVSGAGNGSAFRMIPVLFKNEHIARLKDDAPESREAALRSARIEGAAALGLVSAIGACGGYLIPRTFAASIEHTGSVHGALVSFLVFYGTCMALTWGVYVVPRLEAGDARARRTES
ncbi:MAG: hypothetical protein ACREJ3_09775 [Polyangiaceae bacterium]